MARKEGTGSETRRSSDFLFLREAGASLTLVCEHGLRPAHPQSAAHVEIHSESVSSAETTMACKALCTYAREDKPINAYLDVTHSCQLGRA